MRVIAFAEKAKPAPSSGGSFPPIIYKNTISIFSEKVSAYHSYLRLSAGLICEAL
jgi:hypothetical protein